ncbi:MAG: hypothetical protein AB1898_09635 [Acidobacteriota bacterium]
MADSKLSPEEVIRFVQACQDFTKLGRKFTENIRQSLDELKKDCQPVLESSFVEPSAAEVMLRSLREFEAKLNGNLAGIDKICSKGGTWFAFYLGKAVGANGPGPVAQEPPVGDAKRPPAPSQDLSVSGPRGKVFHAKSTAG